MLRPLNDIAMDDQQPDPDDTAQRADAPAELPVAEVRSMIERDEYVWPAGAARVILGSTDSTTVLRLDGSEVAELDALVMRALSRLTGNVFTRVAVTDAPMYSEDAKGMDIESRTIIDDYLTTKAIGG